MSLQEKKKWLTEFQKIVIAEVIIGLTGFFAYLVLTARGGFR